MALVAGLVAGCNTAPNYLDGSLSETYHLNFDETRIRLYDSELSIEYVDNLTQEGIVALRVTTLNNEGLKPRTRIDLFENGALGRGEGFESPLPDLESGFLRMSDFERKDGSEVNGRFRAVFITPEDTQLTIRGGFQAPLEIVDFL